jgi:hypothetical protein
MGQTKASARVRPGWYDWEDDRVRYWDGSVWTGSAREAGPTTPRTSWVALTLVLVSFVGEWLAVMTFSEKYASPSPFGVPAALWLAGGVLAVVDLVRGRRGRFPRAVASCTLMLWVVGPAVILLAAVVHLVGLRT